VSRRWRKGIAQWVLTVSAFPPAVITVALVVYMLHPADATSLPHGVTARALFFPLHLLVVTVIALGLGLLAWRLRAKLAASIFGLVVALSSFLALWPTIAMWQLAGRENVPLSLGTYLAYATHRDIGGPQLERTVIMAWRLNQLGYHVFDVEYRMLPPERVSAILCNWEP
jgi:hypothetical protein